jgi:queuosine precursor transporter
MLWLVAYVGTIVAANWALRTFGFVPVWPGLAAPAGVFCAGLALGLRDLVQESLGRRWVLGAILAGAVLSALVSPHFALASGAAFLLSEAADFAVYTPLRARSWPWAVILSNVVGDVVDSCLFLLLAFGSLALLAGQLVGKWEMVLPSVAAMWLWRRRDLPERAAER